MYRKRIRRQKTLTPLRIKYVQLIAKGWLYKEIAEHYGIQRGSVAGTIYKIFAIAGVHSRSELVVWARANDII